MRVKTADAAGNQGTATKTVTVSGAGGGSTGGGSGRRLRWRLDRRRRRLTGGGGSTGGGSSAAVQVSAPRKLKARAKSLPVTLTTDTAGKASFALVRSGRVVARGSKAIGAGTASYKLKLPRKAKAGKYVLKVTFTPTGGKASTKTIKVKLAGKAKAAKASASAAGRRARVSAPAPRPGCPTACSTARASAASCRGCAGPGRGSGRPPRGWRRPAQSLQPWLERARGSGSSSPRHAVSVRRRH